MHTQCSLLGSLQASVLHCLGQLQGRLQSPFGKLLARLQCSLLGSLPGSGQRCLVQLLGRHWAPQSCMMAAQVLVLAWPCMAPVLGRLQGWMERAPGGTLLGQLHLEWVAKVMERTQRGP